MQQRGVDLFKGGLFWRWEINYSTYIHSWRFMFDLLYYISVHLTSYLFSDILQPLVQPDLRRRCYHSSCSFASEPEPSGAEVSPAIHVLIFLKKCTLLVLFPGMC